MRRSSSSRTPRPLQPWLLVLPVVGLWCLAPSGLRAQETGGGDATREEAPRPRPPIDAGTILVATESAIDWLARHQDDDGRWDCDGFHEHDPLTEADTTDVGNAANDIGVTGLAVLALLANGHTPSAGEHADVVRRGLDWLVAQQQPSGLVGTAAHISHVYDHAIATYALARAVRLEGDAKLTRPLREALERAVAHLEKRRNPYGAWRYGSRDGDNDTSVTGWALLAVLEAREAGIDVAPPATNEPRQFLLMVHDPETGRFGYTRRGEPSARNAGNHARRFPPNDVEALTAIGVRCLRPMTDDAEVLTKSYELLVDTPPLPDRAAAIDHYYWFHGAHALEDRDDAAARAWRRQLAEELLRTQRKDGVYLGSWDPAGVWGKDGGRIYSTALLCMALRACTGV